MDRYIEKFLTYLEIEKNVSTHTLLNYRIDLKQINEFLQKKDALSVDRLDVRKYLTHLKARNLQRRSINRKLSTLRSFFRFLVREGYLKVNPLAAISSPKMEKNYRYF